MNAMPCRAQQLRGHPETEGAEEAMLAAVFEYCGGSGTDGAGSYKPDWPCRNGGFQND